MRGIDFFFFPNLRHSTRDRGKPVVFVGEKNATRRFVPYAFGLFDEPKVSDVLPTG